jgi:hypothetical protein
MRTLTLAVTLLSLAAPALGAEGDEAAAAKAKDPMAGWTPRAPTKAAQDNKEIGALFKSMEAAAMRGDLDAAAALVDFPVLMATDDSKGEATAETWTEEKWRQVMAPFYKPMPEMKVTHKPVIFLLTDSLATVGDTATMTMGPKKITSRNSMLLVRTDGKWKVKSMVEGGWGDMMKEQPAAAASSGAGTSGSGSTSGTGTPDTGSSSGAGSTGSAPGTEKPGSEKP